MEKGRLDLVGLFVAIFILALFLPPAAMADWIPGDPYKMHFPQLPDEDGWDVNASFPSCLADDFECTETGWVQDIHFWGSWLDGAPGHIDHFTVAIWSDLPVGHPDNPNPYSMPGEPMKVWQVYDWVEVDVVSDLLEGWFDPSTGWAVPEDHNQYIQYNIFLDDQDWFLQEAGTIYWLFVCAEVDEGGPWGWKTADLERYPEPYTGIPFNDDAVWADDDTEWQELFEPNAPNFDGFFLAINQQGYIEPGLSGGSGWDESWFWYAESGWWNMWFYDHPFDPERLKVINLRFELLPFEPGLPMDFVLAVNWSTDLWQDEIMPPLPGFPEEIYIGRDIIEPPFGVWEPGLYDFYYVIRDYNPIWVSVDVMGSNFVIPWGEIAHDCVGQSLDLAFVITGEPAEPEACCFDDGTCFDLLPEECRANAGIPQGPGTMCTAPEGCCFDDGMCMDLDPLCCDEFGGTPQGTGTACSANTSPCCIQGGAICMDVDPLCCDDLGGSPSPTGAAACLGDGDGNGIDDACESCFISIVM
ncbi:hypothetical protein ACFL4G_08315 [Thermodesulfobacteriota bacterium]